MNFLAKILEFWKNSDLKKFEWFGPSPIEPFNLGGRRLWSTRRAQELSSTGFGSGQRPGGTSTKNRSNCFDLIRTLPPQKHQHQQCWCWRSGSLTAYDAAAATASTSNGSNSTRHQAPAQVKRLFWHNMILIWFDRLWNNLALTVRIARLPSPRWCSPKVHKSGYVNFIELMFFIFWYFLAYSCFL